MEPQYLSPEERIEARKRCEAATPGPWTAVERHGTDCIWLDVVHGEHEDEIGNGETQPQPHIIHKDCLSGVEEDRRQVTADLKFAAHAREDLPAALNTIDRLERDLAELLEAADSYLRSDLGSKEDPAAVFERLAEVVSRLKGRNG